MEKQMLRRFLFYFQLALVLLFHQRMIPHNCSNDGYDSHHGTWRWEMLWKQGAPRLARKLTFLFVSALEWVQWAKRHRKAKWLIRDGSRFLPSAEEKGSQENLMLKSWPSRYVVLSTFRFRLRLSHPIWLFFLIETITLPHMFPFASRRSGWQKANTTD